MLVMQIISNGLFIPMSASATDTAPVEQTELTDEEQAQVSADEADKFDNTQQFIADLFADETKSDIKSTVGQPQVTTAEAYIETVAEKDQQLLTDTIVLVKAFIAVNALLNDDKTAIVKDFDEQQLATAKNAVALVDDSFTEGKQVLTERLALVEKSLVKAEVKEQAVAKEQQITKNETTSVEKVAVKAKAVNEKDVQLLAETNLEEITEANVTATVKNGTVTYTSDAQNIIKDGDTLEISLNFGLDIDKIEIKNDVGEVTGYKYKEGAILNYKLPSNLEFINMPATTIKDKFNVAIGTANIVTKESVPYIEIIFNNKAFYDSDSKQGKPLEKGILKFTATAIASDNDNDNKSLIFGAEAENGEIIIPLTFIPKPPQEAKLLTKKAGTKDVTTGNIPWEVIVNGDLSKNGSFTVKDELPKDSSNNYLLEYTEIKIQKLKYDLKGNIKSPAEPIESININTLENKSIFEKDLALDNSTAYKITYITKNISTSDVEKETFTNTVELYDEKNENVGTSSDKIDVSYGTPLEKVKTRNDGSQIAEWEIHYNYNQKSHVGNSATIIDTFDNVHKLQKDSLKIEEVKGDGTSYEPEKYITENADYFFETITDEANKKAGFKITFGTKKGTPEVDGKAYKITYKTEVSDPDGIREPITDSKITNIVKRGDGYTGNRNSATSEYTYNMGVKTHIIDYANQTIKWKIVLNQEKLADLQEVVLTDSYPANRSLSDSKEVKVKIGESEPTINLSEGTLEGIKKSTPITGAIKKGNESTNTEFYLNLGNLSGKTATIEYETPYDVQTVGATPIENNVTYSYKTENKDSASTSFEDSAKIDEKQSAKNGYKQGSYDYTTRTFSWDAGFNYRLENIANGVFEDTLSENQTLDFSSIKMYPVTLGNNTSDSDEQALTKDAMNALGKLEKTTSGFKFTFNTNENKNAYKFKYQSSPKDGVFNEDKYTNNATLVVNTEQNPTRYKQSSDPITIKSAEHTIDKTLDTAKLQKNQLLSWSMIFNKGQSKWNSTAITDTPKNNQLILPDTFVITKLKTSNGLNFDEKEIVFNADSSSISKTIDKDGNYVYRNEENGITVTQNKVGTETAKSDGFIVKFDNPIEHAYKISYDAYFNDKSGAGTSNSVTLKYQYDNDNKDKGDTKTSSKENLQYNDGWGSAERSIVDLKLHKIDPLKFDADGNAFPLAGAKFDLYNALGTVKLASGETDSNGDILFKGFYEGTYQLHEVAAPSGYDQTKSLYKNKKQFKLMKDSNDPISPSTGNQVITKEVANYASDQECVEKTITVKENDTAVNGAIITIKDKDGKVVTLKDADDNNPAQTTVKTDGKGQVKIPLQYAVAGYTFTVENKGVTKEYSFADLIGDCAVEVDLKTSTCKETTITVKNGNNVVENAEIQIIDKDTKQVVEVNGQKTLTTDDAGKVTVPGKYIDKEKYTIEVTVDDITKTITTYASEDCNVTINFATTACTTTTVTVKNGDNVVENAEIQIIDNDTKQAVALDGNNTTVTTDDAGKVTVPGKYIDKEKYTIEVTVDGITKAIVDYSNTDLTTCEVEVNINTAACTNNVLTVKTGSVLVVDGTEVTVKFSDTKTEKYIVKNGKVTFPASEVVDGKVIVSIPNYEEQEITIEHCQGTVEFLSTACIETTVTINNNGIATEDAEIQIIDKDTEQVVEVNGQTTLTTDENGQVKIPGQYVDVNKYVIDVTVNGVTKEISSYAVSDCALTIDFKTTEAACVQTTVTVSNKGQVASGASVKVINKATGAVEEINGQTILTTDVNGQVIVPNEYGDNTKYYLQLTVEGVTRNVVAFTVENCEIVIDFAKACPDFTVSYQGPANSTAAFTLTGEGYSKEITVATDATGKAVYTLDATLKPGQYTLKQTSTPSGYRTAGDVTITVADDKCAAGITVTNTKVPVPPIVPPINPDKCENPTISVTPSTGDKPKAGTTVIVTVDGKTTVGKVDENGKVTFEGTPPTLEPGKKVTVKVDGYKETTTTISEKDCTTTITITPNDKCENPTISVAPSTSDKPEKETKVTVTTEDGKTITGTVNEDGTITFEPGKEPTLEPGKKVTVEVEGYEPTTTTVNDKECHTTVTITPKNACDKFEVTVEDSDGDTINTVRVTIDGKTVKTTNGTYTFDQAVAPGTKVTFEKNGYKTQTVIVGDDCQVTVTLVKKDDSEEPGTDPEDPDNGGDGEDPNDGNTPDEEYPDGEYPDVDGDDNDNNNGNTGNNGNNGNDGNTGNNGNTGNIGNDGNAGNNNNNAGNAGNNTPGNGNNATNDTTGNKAPSTGSSLLPQTGEQVALYSLVGMLLIGAAFMLFKRNRRKA